jgi:hypothetical protein
MLEPQAIAETLASNSALMSNGASRARAMGRLTRIPTSALDTVLTLMAQRAKIAGPYGTDGPAETKSPFLHDRVVGTVTRPDGHLPDVTASSRL